MTNYATISDGNTYFAGKLRTYAWDESNDADKTKALTEATRLIDSLNYIGSKLEDDQVNEFPRSGQEETPDEIEYACLEIAFALLDGVDLESELRNINITQNKIDGIASTYDRSFTPENVLAGIPSTVAWRYLKPYIADSRGIKISRV